MVGALTIIPIPMKTCWSRFSPGQLISLERVKANHGAPGVDDMPINDFMAYAREHWQEIRSSIFANTYKPLPVKRVEIPEARGVLPLTLISFVLSNYFDSVF